MKPLAETKGVKKKTPQIHLKKKSTLKDNPICHTCKMPGHSRSSNSSCLQYKKSSKLKDAQTAGGRLEEFVIKDNLTSSMDNALQRWTLQLTNLNVAPDLIRRETLANQEFRRQLELCISQCRNASFEVGLLDMLHVTRCCENNIPVPLHDQAYYYQLYGLVLNRTRANDALILDDPLFTSVRQIRNTIAHLGNLEGAIMYICSDLSIQAKQNYGYISFSYI